MERPDRCHVPYQGTSGRKGRSWWWCLIKVWSSVKRRPCNSKPIWHWWIGCKTWTHLNTLGLEHTWGVESNHSDQQMSYSIKECNVHATPYWGDFDGSFARLALTAFICAGVKIKLFLGTLSIEGHYIVTYHPHACLNNWNVILNIPCRHYFWFHGFLLSHLKPSNHGGSRGMVTQHFIVPLASMTKSFPIKQGNLSILKPLKVMMMMWWNWKPQRVDKFGLPANMAGFCRLRLLQAFCANMLPFLIVMMITVKNITKPLISFC